jgi:hypothetical protein
MHDHTSLSGDGELELSSGGAQLSGDGELE